MANKIDIKIYGKNRLGLMSNIITDEKIMDKDGYINDEFASEVFGYMSDYLYNKYGNPEHISLEDTPVEFHVIDTDTGNYLPSQIDIKNKSTSNIIYENAPSGYLKQYLEKGTKYNINVDVFNRNKQRILKDRDIEINEDNQVFTFKVDAENPRISSCINYPMFTENFVETANRNGNKKPEDIVKEQTKTDYNAYITWSDADYFMGFDDMMEFLNSNDFDEIINDSVHINSWDKAIAIYGYARAWYYELCVGVMYAYNENKMKHESYFIFIDNNYNLNVYDVNNYKLISNTNELKGKHIWLS